MEAGLVGIFGVVIGAVLSNGLARLIEIRRRHDRTLDIVMALHAEVSASLSPTELQTSDAEVAYSLADDIPFTAADETNFVFDAIKADISILPESVIYPVVRYYKLVQQTNILTNDTRHELFQKQSPAEKRKYMTNLMDLLKDQERAARDVLRALEIYAEKHQRDLPKRAISAGGVIKRTE